MEYIKGQVMNKDFINNFCLLINGLKDVIVMII